MTAANNGNVYCVDTSFFIESWLRRYPPDVFPTLWDVIEQKIESGILVTTSIVLDEIKHRDDELRDWAKRNRKIFLDIDTELQITVREILQDNPRIVAAKKDRTKADVFVVALARNNNYIVVTEEKGDRPEKIPSVCNVYGVNCINGLQLIRQLGLRF